MRLSRRSSWLLVAFAVWSWIIWVTLIKNINADPRSWNGDSPTGFLMVHVCLAVVSLVMGTAIGVLGWKGLRAHKAAKAQVGASDETGQTGQTGRTDRADQADGAERHRERV
jgi:hypothetical protein